MRQQEHFEVLDGLRGIAALLVLVFHTSEVFTHGDPTRNVLPHGALAVDFFFCLSGFVVAHAYDRRWAKGMTLGNFALRRLVRLHPMVVLATVFSTAVWLLDPFGSPAHHVGPGQLALTIGLALFLLPYPSLPDRGNDTHSLDGPMWTLFQEYVGNAAYALVLHRLSQRVLMALIALSALATLATAWHYGTLAIGFGWGHMWAGFVRLAFPFLAGIWIRRALASLPAHRAGLWPLSAMLLAAFALPLWAIGGSKEANGLLHAGLVILLFPALILLGAHSRIPPRTLAVSRFLGRLSYPLYILHHPLIYVFKDYVARGNPDPTVVAITAIVLPICLIALGWGALRWWDEPVRAWLTARLLPRNKAG